MAQAQTSFDAWMAEEYGTSSSQWWYRFIDRRGFLEEDISSLSNDGPLTDYRFHVINGKTRILQVDLGHGTEDRDNPVYDGDLNYLPFDFLRKNHKEAPLPQNIELAKTIAESIAKPFQYCRVDLYIPGEKMFLGEMTFLPNAGRRYARSPELNEMLCDAWGEGPEIVKIVDALGQTIKNVAPTPIKLAA